MDVFEGWPQPALQLRQRGWTGSWGILAEAGRRVLEEGESAWSPCCGEQELAAFEVLVLHCRGPACSFVVDPALQNLPEPPTSSVSYLLSCSVTNPPRTTALSWT